MADDKTAAERAAEERWPDFATDPAHARAVSTFTQGAAWAADRRAAPDRETLARVMVEHYYQERWSGGEAACSCRQWVESVQRKPYTTWSQHVADALLASGVFDGTSPKETR